MTYEEFMSDTKVTPVIDLQDLLDNARDIMEEKTLIDGKSIL